MARIIYGVSGQGFGHSTRSKEILKYLVSQGNKILVFTYGQALFFLDKEFEIFEIPGLGLSYQNNKLVYWRTISKNISQIAKQSKSWNKILNRFREFNPDFVVCDFEPLTALLSKVQRLPLVSIDNQHQLTNTKIKVPASYRKDLLADKLIIKSMVWGADYYLVTSFFQTKIIHPRTKIIPPIIRKEVKDLVASKGDYILVYQTSDFKQLVAELKNNRDHKFVVFGFGKEYQDGNIEFKDYSNHNWLKYLAGCRAIIGNAGLSLISEAIYLQKPYLAIPVKKQVEQMINAYYLENQGYGLLAKKFSQKVFLEFIDSFDKFEHNLRLNQLVDDSKWQKELDKLVKKFG